MAICLLRYWQNRNHLVEGRIWLDGSAVIGVAPELAAHFAIASSRLAWKQGAYADGLASAQVGYDIAEASSDDTLIALASRTSETPPVSAATSSVPANSSSKLCAAPEVGDDVGLASALNNLGAVQLDLDEVGAASASLEEAVRLHRATGEFGWTHAHLAHACIPTATRKVVRPRATAVGRGASAISRARRCRRRR